MGREYDAYCLECKERVYVTRRAFSTKRTNIKNLLAFINKHKHCCIYFVSDEDTNLNDPWSKCVHVSSEEIDKITRENE